MGLQVKISKRRMRRKLRVRGRLLNREGKPRVSVCRTLRHIYAQVIDDANGKTVASFSTLSKGVDSGDGISVAKAVGVALGKAAKAKDITAVVFDRGMSLYHGRVKALADGLREAGLEF